MLYRFSFLFLNYKVSVHMGQKHQYELLTIHTRRVQWLKTFSSVAGNERQEIWKKLEGANTFTQSCYGVHSELEKFSFSEQIYKDAKGNPASEWVPVLLSLGNIRSINGNPDL